VTVLLNSLLYAYVITLLLSNKVIVLILNCSCSHSCTGVTCSASAGCVTRSILIVSHNIFLGPLRNKNKASDIATSHSPKSTRNQTTTGAAKAATADAVRFCAQSYMSWDSFERSGELIVSKCRQSCNDWSKISHR